MQPGSASAALQRLRSLVLVGVLATGVCLAACAGSSPTAIVAATAPQTGLDPAQRAAPPPHVVSTGASVRALWQRGPLARSRLAGGLVLATAGNVHLPAPSTLDAFSALTGQPRWSASAPSSDPEILEMFAGGGVVVEELGGPNGFPAEEIIVKRDVIRDLRSGRELWSVGVPSRYGAHLEDQPIVYVDGLVVIGGAAGGLTAYKAKTGAVVWHRGRPRSCPQGAPNHYDEGLAADAAVLAVSYFCPSHQWALVQRLLPRTGAALWEWQSPAVKRDSLPPLSVEGVAAQGDVVVLSGHADVLPSPTLHPRDLPQPQSWPSRLGPLGAPVLTVALDADRGRPRWVALGPAGEQVALGDGVACQSVVQGVQCRDDRTGRLTRPLITTVRSFPKTPLGDGRLAISRGVGCAVLSDSSSNISLLVFPLRGGGTVAHATVQLAAMRGVEGGSTTAVVDGAAPLAGGATLVVLSREEVPRQPVVALRVAPRPS